MGTTNPDSLTSKSGSDSVSPNSCPQCLHVSAAGSSGQWFVDTGATHHVTPEASNVHHGTDFSGPGKLLVGDGKGLHISKVGSTILQACSRELVLHNLLLVPQITKNLLSVSKFAKDNGVYFEFHADRCLVRDNDSSDVLLHGTQSDGLYSFNTVFSSANNTEAHVSQLSCSEFDTWHRRLGHPAKNVVAKVFRDYRVACVESKVPTAVTKSASLTVPGVRICSQQNLIPGSTSDGPLTTRDDMELVTVGSQGNAGQVSNSTENAIQPPVVSTIVDNQEYEGVLPPADAAFVGTDSGDGGTSDARSSGQSDGAVDRENSSAQVPTEALDFGQEEDAATGLDSSVRMDQGSVSSSSEQPVIEQSSVVQNDAALQPVDNNLSVHVVLRRGRSREYAEMFSWFRRECSVGSEGEEAWRILKLLELGGG
ncbi:hypothetical protein GQ457_10G023250 [Hibiscus cannabinus]